MTTMALCNDHWDELRDAVREEGLEHLESKNPETAAVRTLAEFEESDDPEMFDPTMFAMWNMLANGSRIFGIPLLLIEGCPICWLLTEHDLNCSHKPGCRTVEEITSWPTKAADASRKRYESLVGDDDAT